jgi:hypothetical protein
MSLTELLPAVQSLPHGEKLRLLQFLTSELLREEGVAEPGLIPEIPIWSPFNAFEAAQSLQQAVTASEGRS